MPYILRFPRRRVSILRKSLYLLLTPLLLLVVACRASQPVPPPQVTPDTPPSETTQAPPPAPLVWRACGNFECGTMPVPLSYTEPLGRQIDLALIRQRARDPGDRIGSLLVNPGGPGGSGVEFLRHWAPNLAREIQGRFDIVGFDPRGVGESTPLLCHDDIQKLTGLDPSPDSPDEWREVEAENLAFAALCARRGGDLLPHLGTNNVIRDIDRIRQALGDDKLTFFGYSYGTVLGALYADAFPDKVRAVVLDGAVDMSLSADDLLLQQTLGFEGALERFLANCRSKRCLPASLGDPGTAVDELLRRSDVAPIPAPQADRPAGPGETFNAVLGALYTDDTWPDLARAISAGLGGNGSDLVRLTDRFLDRRPDGSYDNLFEMYNAVTCIDYVFSKDPAHYRALAEQWQLKAPRLGAGLASSGLPCAFWRAPTSPIHAPRAKGAPAILVIGTTGDPATPYQWAVNLSHQLESAVLLTNNGEGHTAYRSGVGCIDSAVNRYLLTLATPRAGTACGDPARSTPIKVTKALTDRRRIGNG